MWFPPLLVGFAMALPLIYLILRSVTATSEAWDLIFRLQTAQILARSLVLTMTVTVSAVLIAVPIAWLTTRTDLPFRKILGSLLGLPLVIPTYVGGFLFISAFGPKGFFQGILESAFGVERIPEIYGLPGATLVLTILSYPYILLTVKGALANLDPALEEVSRTLKGGFWKTNLQVVLPQLRPSITHGSLLVALYTLSDFGAVSLMRYDTFTWVIYQQYQNSFDRTIAALLSMVLVITVLIILASESFTRGRVRYSSVGTGTARVPKTIKLGIWKWVAFGFCSTILCFGLILPLSILVYWVVRGIGSGEDFVFLWKHVFNSVSMSLIIGCISALIALPVAMITVKNRNIISKLLEKISFMGYALPGIVVALSLVYFGANFGKIIYQTIWILLLAYFVLFFPVALGPIRSVVLQIRPNLAESARVLGKTEFGSLKLITIPLLNRALIAGIILVFLVTIKELPASLILGPLGFKTLATEVWSTSSEAFFARAAVPALLLVVLSSVPMAFLMLKDVRVKW